MGGSSSSTVRIENNTAIINKSVLNQKSEQLNKQVSNTTIDQAKQCSSAAGLSQTVDFSGANVKGNFNLNVSQEQAAAVTLSCVQSSSVQQTAGASMIASLMEDLK